MALIHGRRFGRSIIRTSLDFNKYNMNVAKHIMRILEDNSILVSAMGATHFHPLPKNKGLVFYTNGSGHKGWIWVMQEDDDKYGIRYLPSDRTKITEQHGISEDDLVNELSEKVGQSPWLMDYYLDMYFIK